MLNNNKKIESQETQQTNPNAHEMNKNNTFVRST